MCAFAKVMTDGLGQEVVQNMVGLYLDKKQEAQLSQRDRAMRRVS